MEETLHVKADKQVMSLLTINFWSNIVCIGLLAAINLYNLFRGNFGAAAKVAEAGSERLLSPELLLFLSVACIIWLVIRLIHTLRIKHRMEQVFLRLEGGTVSGISLAAPSASSHEYPDGRPFTIDASAMREVFLQDVALIQKQQAAALVIKTEDDTFVVPALAQLNLVRDSLTKLLQDSSASASK